MLTKLVHYVLENMANDGMSASSAQRIRDFASNKVKLCDIGSVLSVIENGESASNAPFILAAIKRSAILFVVGILPFYYFLTIVAFAPCFVIGFFKGSSFEETIDWDSWKTLVQHWGKYPNSFLTKALELYYFGKESIDEPGLEIGVYGGETSRAVFFNKRLQVGMEFVPLHMLHYAVDSAFIHQHLLCGDIYDIPFKENTFRSIFTIHSMDDIQRGASEAVRELSRILKPGGKLVFSSYSGYFGDQNILLRIFRFLGLKRLERKTFELIYVGTHNIFDQKAWSDLLERYGLTVERYAHFIPMWVAWLIDIPFRLEGYLMNLFNFHNALKPFIHGSIAVKIYQFILMKTLCGIWATSFDKNGIEKPGMNIFVVARKGKSQSHLGKEDNGNGFNFADSLQCPTCKNRFESNVEKSDFLEGSFLTCPHCKVRYPVVGNIPILLKEASFPNIEPALK